MKPRQMLLVSLLLALIAAVAPAARAAAEPLYDVKATWGGTYLKPGDGSTATAEGQFKIQARNIGDAPGSEKLTIIDTLPPGVVATAINWPDENHQLSAKFCSGTSTAKVECEVPAGLVASEASPPEAKSNASNQFSPPSGYITPIFVDVSVSSSTKSGTSGINTAMVEGGGAAEPASDIDQVLFDKKLSPFGIVPGGFLADYFTGAFPFGAPARQASDRPFELRVNFDITARTGVNDQAGGDGTRYITSNEQLRTFEFTQPRGLIGNPEATPKCDPTLFAEHGAMNNSTACPPNTQVGYLTGFANDGNFNYGGGQLSAFDWVLANRVPIYNLKPPKGTPIDLAFNAGGLVQGHVYASLDPAQGYAIKTVTPNVSSLVQVRGAEVTIWGVPGDPAHDRFRWYSKKQPDGTVLGAPWGSEPIRPFLTNPMDCGFDNGGARARADSYNHPGQFSSTQEYGNPLNVTGCDDLRFRFEPEISVQPTDRHAGAPTGLDVHLRVPQRNDEVKEAKELYAANGDVQAIATPPIKKIVTTLPEGMTLSPSAAQGLEGCSSEQIGLGTDSPVRCPDASQYGTLTLHTPIFPIDAQPKGWIYIARQGDNPFHNFLSLYMVIQEPERGILIKIPARVDLDPNTGQITTTFDEIPQFPVSDVQLTFKGGVRAGLVNPTTCGTKTIRAAFFSWQDPSTPHAVKSSYEVTNKPDGSRCPDSLGQRSFSPTFTAGTTNNTAGAFGPFALRLARSDDDQEFAQLGLELPEGLTGKLAGVGRCPDAGIAQAQARTAPGDGALEQDQPSCPASSLIGTTSVGAGVGVPLTYVPGKVYLAGPYHGSPLSVVAITPAVAGPFDLGVVAVRVALNVDSQNARISATTDPLPNILQGIPIRIRDIRLKLDRSRFILNPTSCAPKQIKARIAGAGGDLASAADDTAADLADRFQAAECASLGFKPKFSFQLTGGTHRGAHPRLRVFARARPGDANIAAVSVALPRSEFLDQGHIKTVCTRVQFAAKGCPAGSVYGHVVARTPLFDEPFAGPVYLRSSSHPLPDLAMALRGPASLPVEVDLISRVDSVNGGIRNTVEVAPDVPLDTFTLTAQGGAKGLLVNSTNLCAGGIHRATVKLTAQNGKRITLHPPLRAKCGAKRARKH